MRVVLFLGKAQQGKTTLAWRAIKRTTRRVLVLDPVRSKPLTDAITALDAEPFLTWAALAEFLASESANRPWRIVLRSQDESDYARALQAAPFYCNTSLLVDEALWFVDSDLCYTPLKRCARANAHFGGGLGVPLWLTAQRPMDIPPDIRSQATQVVSFRQEEPRDLAFLSERFGPSFAEEVAGLSDHRWIADPPLEGYIYDGLDEGDSRGHRGRGHSVGSVPTGPRPERHFEASPVDKVTSTTTTEE